MDLDEIRREARKLAWTREQAFFLADRIRNALVILGNPAANAAMQGEARAKLLATIETIEDAVADERSRDADRAREGQPICYGRRRARTSSRRVAARGDSRPHVR